MADNEEVGWIGSFSTFAVDSIISKATHTVAIKNCMEVDDTWWPH